MIRRFQSLLFSFTSVADFQRRRDCVAVGMAVLVCALGCGGAYEGEKKPLPEGMVETVVVADHSTYKPPPPGSKDARYQAAADAYKDTTLDAVQVGATIDTLGAIAFEDPVDGVNYYAGTLYLDGLVKQKRYDEACERSPTLHDKLCLQREPIDADVCATFLQISDLCRPSETTE